MLYICIGGPSNEREVSLRGGEYMHEILTKKGVAHTMVTIDSDLSAIDTQGRKEVLFSFLMRVAQEKGHIYPLLHGAFGEDGIFAGICESLGVHLLASSSGALALMMDKDESKKVLNEGGIATPQGMKILGEELGEMDDEFFDSLIFPLIIKPNAEGSSQGLALVRDRHDLMDRIQRYPLDREYLLEERIVGREFSVGVLEYRGKTISLPATEVILTKTDLFDEEAKYTPDACREVTPAHIDSEVMSQLQSVALTAHQLCGARHISRTDMILTDDGRIVVLEINALPGMTRTSFIPAQLAAIEMDMGDIFIDWVK